MAERRMFAKTIVLSDAFLDMPLSTRCLYFTLGMLADDDGFVNSPRAVMRQCGASVDDLNVLISKKFILAFDDGVVVIKHWRINNYLQKDRYTETKYLEDKDLLEMDQNNSYRLKDDVMYTQCMYTQDVYTQDSIGKDSKGNNISFTNVKDTSLRESDKDSVSSNVKAVIDAWNQLSSYGIAPIRGIKNNRLKLLNARIREYGFDAILEAIENVKASDFLQGKKKDITFFDFDWFIRPNNFQKVLEGRYGGTKPANNGNTETGNYDEIMRKKFESICEEKGFCDEEDGAVIVYQAVENVDVFPDDVKAWMHTQYRF